MVLGVEEQFYLIFPLFLASVWALSSNRTRRLAAAFLAVLVIMIGASFSISYYTSAEYAFCLVFRLPKCLLST